MISVRYEDLELRGTRCDGDVTLEIVQWAGNYCYTIATFKKDEDFYNLVSIGDRIISKNVNWYIFNELVKEGFKYLEFIDSLYREGDK